MMNSFDPELHAKYDRLKEILSGMEHVLVAMSGGVDSVLLAKVAYEVLGENALAVTADSPSLPRRELRLTQELAQQIGIQHRLIKTTEFQDPRYSANPVNRCYFCKEELFGQLDALLAELGTAGLGHYTVLFGENADDQGDYRPGSQAAHEHGARAPLKDAGLTKPEIRRLAQHLGLPVWDKPAMACLASRFPYGSEVTPEKVAQVEAAEDVLFDLGFRQYRVRHHGDLARLEVEPAHMPRLIEHGEEITQKLKALGFRFVAMDLTGYRMGSLNEGVVTIRNHEVG